MRSAANIEAVIIRETAKAYYLNIAGCSDSTWVPKSQMQGLRLTEQTEDDGTTRFADFTLPAWLHNKLPWKRGPIPQATRPF